MKLSVNNPLVSIVIPTRNSALTLEKCLESIQRQTYPNIEVIIVDQESVDNTIKIARKYKAKTINLPKPTFYTPPTKSRNAGAKISSGTILYHLDSDMILSPDLVAEIADKLSGNKSIGALIIHEIDLTNGFWSKAKAFERKCYWGDDRVESSRAVRKDIFENVKGYDENISSGEDFDIHRRYKKYTKIGFCENVAYHNLGYLRLGNLLRKKYLYGKTASLYFKKSSSSGTGILYDQFRCYLRNYFEFIKHPIMGLSAIMLKLMEFGSGALGYLVSIEKSK